MNLAETQDEAVNLDLAHDISTGIHKAGEKVGATLGNGLCVYPTESGNVFSAIQDAEKGAQQEHVEKISNKD